MCLRGGSQIYDSLKPLEHHSNIMLMCSRGEPQIFCREALNENSTLTRQQIGDKAVLSQANLLTQLQAVPLLSSLYPSLISFSSFTFPGAPYRIVTSVFFPGFLAIFAIEKQQHPIGFLVLFFPWLPCHFYFVVIAAN